MAIITASEYKTYAGISDTSLDARLAVLIPIAQERIETMCGRPAEGFATATWTQDFSGRGGFAIKVPCWPVTSITSVSCRDSSGDLTALDTESYWISDDARFVERSGSQVSRGYNDPNTLNDDPGGLTGQSPAFADGNKNYRVIYVGGYSSIPNQIKMAAYRMLDQMIADTRTDPSVRSETDGHYSYTKGDRTTFDVPGPLDIEALLANWIAVT